MGKNDEDKNARLEELREKALKDIEEIAPKIRHGLFSQPPPLSIGNQFYNIGKRRVNEDNKVIIENRGIMTNPIKKGKDRTVYLDKEYLRNPDEQKDPYISTVDVANLMTKQDLIKLKKGEDDRTKFYHAKTKWNVYNDKGTKRIGNPYPNMPADPIKEKKILKDENGKVLTKKPNIKTNPMKKGNYGTTVGHLFNKIDYKDQGYDGLKKIEYLDRKKLNEYNKKIDRGQFKPASLKGGNLTTDKKLYGFDKELPPVPTRKKIIKEKGIDREPFKPSNPTKKGYKGLISGIVPYIDHEGKGVNKGNKNKFIHKEGTAFYPSTIPKTRPTPSICLLNCRLR